VNSRKVNYFSMFGSIIESKLENNFQYLVMLKNELENNLLMFFFKFIKIIRNKSYKLKS